MTSLRSFTSSSAYVEKQAAAAPLALHHAVCEIATDYHKKKNVLRVRLADGAEYLLTAHSSAEMNTWISKIQFHAGMIETVKHQPA